MKWLVLAVLFAQVDVLGLICYAGEEGLYPATWRFLTYQKLKGDILSLTLNKITFIVLPSIGEHEETIFSLKPIVDLMG